MGFMHSRLTGISQKKIRAKTVGMATTQKMLIYVLCDVHFFFFSVIIESQKGDH